MAAGWPPCLHKISAAALWVKDDEKLTLRENLTIIAPHALEGINK